MLTSRQRLQMALHHQQPDRVPMDLGATRNSGITMAAYTRLVAFLGEGGETKPLGTSGTSRILGAASPDEWLLERLGIDTRGIFLSSPQNWHDVDLGSDTFQDEWGVIWQRPPESQYYDPIKFPLAGDISLSDVLNYPMPDLADDQGYTQGLRERAQWLYDQTEYGLVLHLQDICVHGSQWMRGYAEWFMDMALQPTVICALMDAILERRLAIFTRAVEAVGGLVDVISCSDDVADQRGPIVSPDMYRQYVKPRHKQVFDMIHARSNAKVLFHTDGAIYRLLPDFIEIGIDFVNPVQVSANGMDTARLKREFGADIGFWGGIDNLWVLPSGTPEDVRAEVALRIGDLGRDGGYVLGAVHNIQSDVPPENIVAIFDSARQLGNTPIMTT